MYNLDGMIRLRDWAQRRGTERERFDFGGWAHRNECGTTLCLAGKVAADNGVTFLWSDTNTARKVVGADGRDVSIQAYGAWALGISGMESVVLFAPDRSDGDLNERCALEFLDALIERARNSMDSMSDREALDWMNAFFRQHDPANAEEDEKEEGRWS